MGQPFSQIHICCYIGNCETHLFTERVVQYNQIREQQKRVLRWIDYIVQPSMMDEEFHNA